MANIIQDRAKAITAEDLIRRYDLDSLKTDRKNIISIRSTLIKQYTIIKEFVINISSYRYESNDLITWFYNGTPTIDNEPFTLFENKDDYLGNLYYDRETGKAYQLLKDEDYYWQELDDYNLIKSLALANGEADTADNKRRIFFDEPKTPYEIGDIWLDGNTIMRCRCARSEGEYNFADWIIQDNYSNDLYLNDTRAVLDQFRITVEKDFVTKVQLETTKDSITASVDAITTEIVTTATAKYEYYDEQLAEIKVNVGNIKLEVSDVQTSLGEKITDLDSKIDIKAGEISQSVEDKIGGLETKITQTAEEINQTITDTQENLESKITQTSSSLTSEINKKVDTTTFNSRISQTESSIENKVSKGDISSYVRQYYDQVIYGFNNASSVVKLATSGISLYRSGSLRVNMNENDLIFYQSGYTVGNIGTSQYAQDSSQKGLVFQLDSGGKYMGWSQRSSSSGSYTLIMAYNRSNSIGHSDEGIYFGRNVYGNNWNLYDFNINSARANNYEAVDNKNVKIVTDINVDEKGNLIIEKASINVRSGLITSVPENSESI